MKNFKADWKFKINDLKRGDWVLKDGLIEKELESFLSEGKELLVCFPERIFTTVSEIDTSEVVGKLSSYDNNTAIFSLTKGSPKHKDLIEKLMTDKTNSYKITQRAVIEDYDEADKLITKYTLRCLDIVKVA